MLRLFALTCCCLFGLGWSELPPPYQDNCLIDVEPAPLDEHDHLGKVDINLDLPPAERFKEVAGNHTAEIKAMILQIKQLLGALLGPGPINWVDKYLGKWADRFPETYREEMKGIAEATGINLGEIVFYNIFYEISSMCTAIIARGEDGGLLHARTMDFGVFMGWDIANHTWGLPGKIRPMTRMARYMRGGKVVFEGVLYPGFVGQFSAYKPGAFGITMNQRFALKGGYLGVIKWLMEMGNEFVCLKVRTVMETANTYEEVQKMFQNNTGYTSPAYLMVSGKTGNEGCLLIVGLDGIEKQKCLDDDNWYLVQTNYDKKSPFFDERKLPAEKCLDKMSQKRLSVQNLYTILNSIPNLNKLTVYAHVMQQSLQYNEGYLRYCPDPCWFV